MKEIVVRVKIGIQEEDYDLFMKNLEHGGLEMVWSDEDMLGSGCVWVEVLK